MHLSEFKLYARYLIEESKFFRLLKIPAGENKISREYLASRALNIPECYYYEGKFNYKGTEYILDSCIVIPLRSCAGDLRGVWIRFINQKKFFIWVLNINPEPQKYWLHPNIDLQKPVYVAEGIFDAVSLGTLLNTNQVVACLGVQPSADLMALLPNEVILALDNDAAGKTSALKLLTTYPQWGIIQNDSAEKDFNDILISKKPFNYKILQGIQAKIYLRSII